MVDFVAVPCDKDGQWLDARVVEEVDLSMANEDHRATAVTLRLGTAVPDPAPVRRCVRACPRSGGTAEEAEQFRRAVERIPAVPWSADVHTHAQIVIDALHGAAKEAFGKRSVPRQAWLDEEVWRLVCDKREWRRQQHVHRQAARVAMVRGCFAIWAGRAQGVYGADADASVATLSAAVARSNADKLHGVIRRKARAAHLRQDAAVLREAEEAAEQGDQRAIWSAARKL